METKKLTGLCACPGEISGQIKYYQPDQVYTSQDVVILNEWVTQNVAALRDVGGLLSSTGGLTCHASIIAREFNIPCLVSVQGLEAVQTGSKVQLDAASEEIIIYG